MLHFTLCQPLSVSLSNRSQACQNGNWKTPIDKRFRPIFKFLKKLTLTPYKMIQADADAVYAEGWDERALHDVIMLCCCFSFMNRLADGHGLASHPALFKARATRHVQEGYLAQYQEQTKG